MLKKKVVVADFVWYRIILITTDYIDFYFFDYKRLAETGFIFANLFIILQNQCNQ